MRDEFLPQRGCVPDPSGDKVVQPVVGDALGARRHGLDALALAQPDQAGTYSGHIARRAGCDRDARNG
ncbi:hypothetical protein MEX01_49160 [Methylorubrum extorquens]|nr:hypothetical protein MEX01_49160 [Methylorubrum extorquens]